MMGLYEGFNKLIVVMIVSFQAAFCLESMIRECYGSYCYHLHNASDSMIFIWSRFQWMKLPQLQTFCQENVSPSSWLLELHSEEEQKRLENFIEQHPTAQRSVAPPIVPLNLRVSFLDSWTWIGSQTKLLQSKSIIFGRNLKNLNGSHFVFLMISNISFYCDQSPSFVALYRAICEIQIEHCGKLSGALHADGYCFYIVEDVMNWHQAREFCRSKHGDLATFQGETKILFFLINFASSLTNLVGYWIGLTNIQEVWLKRNESAIYANWGSVDLSAINYTVEMAYLNLERKRWLPVLPATFQMRIVCMTDHDRNYRNLSLNFQKDEKCYSSIWLAVLFTLTSVALFAISIAFVLEKRKNSRTFHQDQQVIFDKTVDSPYTNFSDSTGGSNPAARNDY